jgi:hypothetical protein
LNKIFGYLPYLQPLQKRKLLFSAKDVVYFIERNDFFYDIINPNDDDSDVIINVKIDIKENKFLYSFSNSNEARKEKSYKQFRQFFGKT